MREVGRHGIDIGVRRDGSAVGDGLPSGWGIGGGAGVWSAAPDVRGDQKQTRQGEGLHPVTLG